MELIIILLIAVEVVIVSLYVPSHWIDGLKVNCPKALIREGPDLWRMVRGEKEEDKLSVSA